MLAVILYRGHIAGRSDFEDYPTKFEAAFLSAGFRDVPGSESVRNRFLR
mgnify:CR=1 FL=1